MTSSEIESKTSGEKPGGEGEVGVSVGTLIKFGFFAGLIFAGGYWYAKLTIPKTEIRTATSDVVSMDGLKQKQAEYEKIQKQLKLSYYKELSAEPRRVSFEREPIAQEKELPATPAKTETATPAPVAEKEEQLPEPKAPKVEERKPSSDRIAKALEKVLGSETPDLVATAAKVKLPTQTGSPFAVQVASLPDRKVAEELANRLNLKGYPARLVQADLPGRGIVYRVRIHGFESRHEAEEARSLISAKEKLDAITVAQ